MTEIVIRIIVIVAATASAVACFAIELDAEGVERPLWMIAGVLWVHVIPAARHVTR